MNQSSVVKENITHFYDKPFIKLSLAKVSFTGFDGQKKQVEHFVIKKKDAVCVTLYDPKIHSFIFVKQFRIGPLFNDSENQFWTIEPVAGHIDGEEEPIYSAQREILEEIGADLRISEITPIAKGYTSAGILTELHHHFFANVDSSHLDFESSHGIDDEDIQIIAIHKDEVLDMISRGEIATCSAILGVSLAMAKGLIK